MQQSNNKLFYVITSILIVIACYFADYYFLIPSYKKVQSDLATAESQSTAAAAKKDSLVQSKQTLDSAGDLLNKVMIAIPSGKDTPNTISELEAIAKKNNTTIPTIQIKDTASSASSSSATPVATASNQIDISISISGAFGDLNNFITDVENDLKFFEVKGFGFNSSGLSTALTLQLAGYKQSQSFSLLNSADSLPETQN